MCELMRTQTSHFDGIIRSIQRTSTIHLIFCCQNTTTMTIKNHPSTAIRPSSLFLNA